MITSTRDDIYRYIKNRKKTSVKNLVDKFGISAQMIHRHLKKLTSSGKISKTGKPPKVFYIIKNLATANQGKKQSKRPNLYGQGVYDSGAGKKKAKENSQAVPIKKKVDKKTPPKKRINIIMDKLKSNKKGIEGIVRVKK